MMSYDRRIAADGLTDTLPPPTDEEKETFGEIQVAEYIVFLLALDTYLRYLEEVGGEGAIDDLGSKGVLLLRLADHLHIDTIGKFLSDNLSSVPSKAMLERALRLRPTAAGAGRRALMIRTILSRGGTGTMRAVFKTNKALAEIKAAISAAKIEDADQALDKFAVINVKNPRIRTWIDQAAKLAGAGLPPGLVNSATKGLADDSSDVMEAKLVQQGATAPTEADKAVTKEDVALSKVETEAKAAAKRSLEQAGQPDTPVTRSEAVGIATAAAVAAMSDPDNVANLPPALRAPMDPEQRAAAISDGRVLVAAGAGAGKCIEGNTLVRTVKGLIPIKEFASSLRSDQQGPLRETILGLEGPEYTDTIFHNGIKKTRILTTRMGFKIEGTYEHPLYVLREGTLQWVKMGDIDESDVVCIDRRPGFFAEAAFHVKHTPTLRTNAKASNVPEELTTQVAALLGYIISEGCVRYGNHSGIDLTTTDPKQHQLYEAAINDIIDRFSQKELSDNVLTTRFHGKALIEALFDFGLTFTKAHEKEVPHGILRSPKRVVTAFLRALFDGDGGFNRHTIEYCSASEKLARQVHLLLLSFGVVGRLKFRPNDHKGGWYIYLTGDNARLFLKEIGFNLRSKQYAAEEALNSVDPNTNVDVIPQQAGAFASVLGTVKQDGGGHTLHPKYHAFKCYANGTRNPSKAMLLEFLEAYPTGCEAHCHLYNLASNPWYYDTIDSLDHGEAEVFDFCVPRTHSFSAGGFVNHNSTTLVRRLRYLLENKNVSPSRIFVCSFNSKAAADLKESIDKEMGPGTSKRMAVGTMHSLFRRFIGFNDRRGYGTDAERAMISDGNLIADDRDKGKGDEAVAVEEQGSGRTNRFGRKPPPKAPNPAQMTFAIKGMLKDCGPAGMQALTGFPEKLFEGKDDKLSAKACKKLIENWRGNAIDFRTAREGATTIEEVYASVWYEMYLGLKGDLGPNWRPSCDSQSFKRFQSKFRPFDPQDRERSEQNRTRRFGDLDDMVRTFRDILIRDPKAREAAQNSLDHILVDEAQDLNVVQHEIFELLSEKYDCDGKDGKSLWIVGDDKQCPSAETPILTPRGEVLAKYLHTGDEVIAWRNGQLKPQRATVSESSWAWGLKITTDSGKTLTVSPNHKIWATPPELEPHQTAVYLMFRRDMGFRIGITSKGQKGADYLGSFAGRAFQESAEKMWILAIHNDRESAKLEETAISLQYGIPTLVFNGTHRRLNQDRINQTFAKFGRNGMRCLEDRHLSLDLPHWVSKGYAKHGRDRRVVQLLAHTPKFSFVRLEWSRDEAGDNPLAGQLKDFSYETTCRDRFRLRRGFVNYREALEFAVDLARKTDALLSHTLSTPEDTLQKVTASVVYPGMRVPVQSGDSLTLEEVVSVERCEGLKFVNIEVDDASNFFGGGILSSNSIYQFRGARPSLFSALDGKDCWKKRLIQTNYRCEPEIVEGANKIAANNAGQIPMQCRADPRKKTGKASVNVIAPGDYIDGAFEVLDGFSRTMSITGDKASQFAVLSRNNAELDAFEDQCILREIPYRRSKGSGFLDSNESRVVLGYMDLALSSDMQELQEAFVNAITKPDRGMFLSREAVEKIVRDAYKEAAHDEGVDARSFNPLDFLTRRQTAKKLAYMLKAPQKQMWIAIAQRSKGQGGGRGYNRSNNDDLWLFDKKVDEMTDQLMEMGNQIVAIRQAVKAGRSTLDTLNSILDTVKVETGYLNRRTGEDTRKTTTLREQIRADISFNRDPEEDGTSDEEKKVVLDDTGKPVEDPEEKEKADAEEDPIKGLGTVRYLFQLAEPNDKDKAIGLDPSNGRDFYRKIDRYKQIAKELQDPEKYPDRLTLSTIHSVKGAQWNHVALCMSHGFFPGLGKDEADALSAELQRLGLKDPRDPAKHAEAATKLRSIDEDPMTADRNLAYVGVTRAKEDLTIVCSQERVPPKMSVGGPRLGKFVYEAGWHLGENVVPPEPADPPVAPAAVQPAPAAIEPPFPADIEPAPSSEPGVNIEDVHLASLGDDNTALDFVDVALAATKWAEDT
jgi:superfamily I DNA/RNA helicase/intein/homing endonuclease